MAKLPKIEITENEELRKLMAYEFYHDSGTKSFDPSQCNKYLKRLKDYQKSILRKSNIDELTSFVVFGDGVIEQKMGDDENGTYVYDDNYEINSIIPKINSINKAGSCKCGNIETITAAQAVDKTLNLDIDILPNASFAIFRKLRRNIELVFYTRFFVINYYMLQDCGIVSRYFVKELTVLLDKGGLTDEEEEQKKKLKESIFKCMQKIFTVFCSCGVSSLSSECFNYGGPEPQLERVGVTTDKTFKYYLSNMSIDPDYKMPYISIVDNARNPVGWMKGGGSEWNTIHGTLSTKGCWMIFKNDTYYYYTDHEGNKFNKNYTYYEFLRHFAGIQYNAKDASIKFPPLDGKGFNSWDPDIPITWGANIANKTFGQGMPWTSLFFFKRIDRFTPEDGDEEEFIFKKKNKFRLR